MPRNFHKSWSDEHPLFTTVVVVAAIFVLILFCKQAFGAKCLIVVKDWSTAAQRGADSLIQQHQATTWGMTTTWGDIDTLSATPATYNSAWFETFDLIITVGAEVAAPTPSAYMDTINNCKKTWITLNYNNWDEIQLGTNSDGTNGRELNATGYMINNSLSHYITRTSQDTILGYNTDLGSLQFYGLVFPDTFQSIVPLIVVPAHKTDTANVMLAVADSGVVVINTGTPIPAKTKNRRAFFGLFSTGIPANTTSNQDSCLIWRLWDRTVAWALNDTTNDVVTKNVCASGRFEITLQHTEGNNANNQVYCYGSYNRAYIGQDFDEKVTFMRLTPLAIQRLFINEYRSLWTDTVYIHEYLGGIDHGTTNNWELAYTYKPIKVGWSPAKFNPANQYGCTYSVTCPFACWTYAWKDTSVTPNVDHSWTSGGAQGDSTDRYNEYEDSVHVKRTDSPATKWFDCALPTARFNITILDTATALGWVSDVLYTSEAGAGPELQFYSSNTNPPYRPRLMVTLDSFSVTVPSPTIALSQSTLNYSMTEGGSNPAYKYVDITNAAGGQLSFTCANDSSWLSTRYFGEAPDRIYCDIANGGRPNGIYEDIVVVTCADATNTPQHFHVILTINEPSGAPAIRKIVGVRKQ